MTFARHHALFSIAALAASVTLNGCALDDVTTTSLEVGCPVWGCGENLLGIEVASEQQALYDHGVAVGTVKDVLLGGTSHELHVMGSEFWAVTAGKPPVTGSGIVGAVLVTQQDPRAPIETLHITGYDVMWGVARYQIEDDQGVALCPGDGEMIEPGAVLMANERYDNATKTVSASGAGAEGWFNLACLGSVLAKLKFNGYDPGIADPQDPGYTTVAQRQAMLKAYTADYCGTGTSFTQDHQLLEVGNRTGTVQPGAYTTLEAIWDQDGAVALDVPRLQSAYPDIMDDIMAECGGSLPGWPTHPGDWPTTGSDIKTYNP